MFYLGQINIYYNKNVFMDNNDFNFNEKKPEEEIDKTREITDSDLFDIKLLEESEELNEIKGEKKKKPKNRVSLFFSRHKKFFIIFFSSIALVLTIALIIYGVRISSVTKECRKINSQGYYSRQYITDELKAKGFNDFEIERAIKKNKISFEANISKSLLKLIEQPTSFINKNKMIEELSKQGYTDSEIENLFLILNWEEFLDKYLANYIANQTGTINKRDVLTSLQAAGFDQDDINNISISEEWVDLGKSYVKKYFEENPNSGKTDVREYLSTYEFSTSDIEKIFDTIDWKKQALTCINNYLETISKNSATAGTRITEALFELELKKLGFNEDEIQYAIDNYDFSNAIDAEIKALIKSSNNIAKKSVIRTELKKMNYSDEDIEKVFAAFKWEDYAVSTCTEYLATNKSNKNDALTFLKNNGYTDAEIEYAKGKIVWGTHAAKALGYLQDGNNKKKDELFSTLESYGYTQDEINTAKNSISSYSKYAYNYVINTQSADALSKMSQKELQTILNNGGYGDEYNTLSSSSYFNFTTNASNYLATIMSSILSEPKVYNMQADIVEVMNTKGFTSVQSVIKNYGWYNFAKEWVNKYFANKEVSKKEFIGADGFSGIYFSMKINADGSSSLGNIYPITEAMWVAEATNIASAHKDSGEDTVRSLLTEMGYTTEIDQAITSVFSGSQDPVE